MTNVMIDFGQNWTQAAGMHVADYIAIGVLIACMLGAGAMVFYKAR